MLSGQPPVTDRVLGLLAQTMGQFDDAVAHLEDALTFCRGEYRPELANTSCECAELLLQRDAAGDRQRASELLDESLALAGELSMRPLEGRVRAVQRTV